MAQSKDSDAAAAVGCLIFLGWLATVGFFGWMIYELVNWVTTK